MRWRTGLQLLLTAVLSLHGSAFAGTLSGTVRDPSGTPVPGAVVEIRSLGGLVLAVRHTDFAGRFEWDISVHGTGRYRFQASARGVLTSESVVYVGDPAPPVEIRLNLRPLATHVVVSATRGSAEQADASPHATIVRDFRDMAALPLPTIGNSLDRAPGIHLQQSTLAQVSPFLRGLTGYHVLNVVDGVRFNNSTFRSGPNQYLAWIDPLQAERIEATLGPTGPQYGSDSLGGTIQILTPQARFQEDGPRKTHGSLFLGGSSADLSGSAAGRLSVSDGSIFWLGSVSGRRHNDLRAGGGIDSRNVYHRLFGMPLHAVRTLVGSRQQDSGFGQLGLHMKLASRFRSGGFLSMQYAGGRQFGVRGYKDLLGGLGRLKSDFDPQSLHWVVARYERLNAGILDSVTGTFSLNSQADGSRRQNLLATDPITRDYSRVNVFGYSGQATVHRGRKIAAAFGGELYDERIASERDVFSPATGSRTYPRPQYPDGSVYRNLGLFVQASYDILPGLRSSAALRFTSVMFNTRPNPAFGIPAGSQAFNDTTFHSSLSWQLFGPLGLHGVVSRGFRAPNLSDLGAIGLNDLGYEIPAAETLQAGALLSTDAGETALSKGTPAGALRAESLLNYEFGLRVTTRRVSALAQFFDSELHDPIVRRTLLFPASAVPDQLAGLPVTPVAPTTAQRSQGVVAVATALDPRAVKAFVNDGQSRYYGLETRLRCAVRERWTVEANYSYILGRDLNPNRNARRLPPRAGSATLRYDFNDRRPWIEVSVSGAGRQDRLSGADRDDERIGASFRRRDIADFFNGSRVAPFRNAGVFVPTGESLQQIQGRVLPIGGTVNGIRIVDDNTRVPLYLSTAGWVTIGIRSGMRLTEEWHLNGALENALDRNYRYHGSGLDAPGRTAYVALSYRF